MIENFGSNIARLRKEKGMRQEELAEKLGVSKQTISNIEKGEGYPTFKNLDKLSQILNAGPIQLFGTMKEIALSDTPVILEKIDEYDNKVQNLFKIMDFFKDVPLDKIERASNQLHFIQSFLSDPIQTDEEGEPIFTDNNEFSTTKSNYSQIPFEQIEKTANQLHFIVDNKNKA